VRYARLLLFIQASLRALVLLASLAVKQLPVSGWLADFCQARHGHAVAGGELRPD
jgi:hypothetical protein